MKKLSGSERKKEIREAALKLFITKGFDKTSIQNILDVLSLSKGGFYHHYKSKEELLDDIAIDRAEAFSSLWSGLNERSDLTGMEKFIETYRISNAVKAENLEKTLELWSVLYKEENSRFRLRILEKQIEMIIPHLIPHIEQAVAEDSFHTAYPEECIALIMRYSDKTMEKILPYLLRARDDSSVIPRIYKEYEFLFHMMERILGAPEGSMKIFPEGFFENAFDPKED